ncbi:hypothetical protein SAMN05443550_102209 [Pedobacter hartonius]|uniref:Uncharacterized protein n=1 Tax=Pedobacter hartonius TaxID=425514 RepID=A0A1H3Z1M7_9SPHI|nr:hypothetical protein SAMN05443550_102209 [Pedobacter hartonius]
MKITAIVFSIILGMIKTSPKNSTKESINFNTIEEAPNKI